MHNYIIYVYTVYPPVHDVPPKMRWISVQYMFAGG